jgi:hypothetical protein
MMPRGRPGGIQNKQGDENFCTLEEGNRRAGGGADDRRSDQAFV